MTDQCHPDLRRLALAVTVDSPGSFSILGRPVAPGADRLLEVLESELYRRLYCGATEPRSPQTEDPAESAAFIGALSQANRGSGTWEPGWRIAAGQGSETGEGQGGGAVTAIRDGVIFRVKRSQVRTASGTVSPGELCSVRIGKEMRHLLFGFYLAQGNAHPGDGAEPPVPLLRLYWHLTPAAAIGYIQEATGRLNEAGLPFQTKVVSNPRHYVRSDSGVLYLRKADFAAAAPIVKAIYQTVKVGLLPEVPLFTKPLAPGLGLAESPEGGMSFGQSRCRTAAQGLWQSHAAGRSEADGRLTAIAEAFRAEGLDPGRPYLEPGSADCYAMDLESGEGGGLA